MDHKEAFCHMQYQNKRTAGIKSFWNSRDGVTPMFVFLGGDEYSHVNWQDDRYDPGYSIQVGDLIWVSIDEQMAREMAEKAVDTEHFAPLVAKLGREDALQSIFENYYGSSRTDDKRFQGTHPTSILITEENINHWREKLGQEIPRWLR